MKLSTYYRRFTELLPKYRFISSIQAGTPRARYFTELVIIWSGLSFLMLAGVSVWLYQQTNLSSNARYKEEQQLAYWEQTVQQQPNYPRAYYEVAVHAARLHDFVKAAENIQKSLLLDPNFKQAEVFAQEINK